MTVSAAGTVKLYNVMSPKFADISEGLAYTLIMANQTAVDVTIGTFRVEGADASANDPCVPGTWSPLKILPDCSPSTGAPTQKVTGVALAAGGASYNVGDTITLSRGVILAVETKTGSAVTTVSIVDAGMAVVGALPANPVAQTATSGNGTGATFNLTWTDSDEASISLSPAFPLRANSQCGIAVECPKQFVRIFSQTATNLELLAAVTRLRRTGM